MLCNKCGKENNSDAAVCEYCGENLLPEETVVQDDPLQNTTETQAEDTQPVAEASVSTAEIDTEDVPSDNTEEVSTPPSGKKSILKVIAAVAVALAVLVAGVFVSACIFPTFRHTLLKTFLSPADYFKVVIAENVKYFSDDLSASSDILKANSYDYSSEGSVTVEIGKGLKDFIGEAAGEEVASVFNVIDSIRADVVEKSDKTGVSTSADFKINNKHITSLDVVVDYDSNYLYTALPDVNSSWLKSELPSSTSLSRNSFTAVIDNIPEKNALEDLLVKYATIIVKQIDDVSKSNDTIESNGISAKATRLNVRINEKSSAKIVSAVLKEARDDSVFRDIILSYSDEVAYQTYVEYIDDTLSELENEEYTSDESFEFYIWVDGKGVIMGIGTEIDGAEINCFSFTKNKVTATEFTAGSGFSAISFKGSVTETDGKYNGSYTLGAPGITILNVNVSDFDAKKSDKGVLSGTISISTGNGLSAILSEADTLAAEIISTAKLVIFMDSQSITGPSTSKISFYTGDDLWFSIDSTQTVTKGATVSLPSGNVYDSATEGDKWLESCDFAKLFENLVKAGFSQEFLSLLLTGIYA